MGKNGRPAARVAAMGLLFALGICLSFVESLVPSPLPVPGVKLGLSNVVTMYALFALGPSRALTIAVLKGLFALLTRGGVSALLSLSGGLCSVAVMALLLAVGRGCIRVPLISMAGAVIHNVGQLAAAAWVLRLGAVMGYYLPVLVASGVVMGLLTAMVLRATRRFLFEDIQLPF